MKKNNIPLYSIMVILFSFLSFDLVSQDIVKKIVVKPKEINDILINPGIGFMTFQRFNGDELNDGIGWTEGFPIEYQDFDGNLEMKEHPMTSIVYFRLYWRFLEPEQGRYNWDHIDKALKTAHNRKQQLLFRVAPYGTKLPATDVPDWYRKMVGDTFLNQSVTKHWQVDHEDPRYIEHFGNLIREMGKRYDGHPDLNAIDLSIIGAWGEGEYTELLSDKTMKALVDAYLESFTKTPLIMQLTDLRTNSYGLSKANVGWRVDCLGDLGFWAKEQNGFTHMYDVYPQDIINCGMKDAWKKGPVSLEACGTIKGWKEKQDYTIEDVRFIINESLKWHISSYNNKSSGIPEEWWPEINQWIKKMGYRFVLRKFTYPETCKPGKRLFFTTWWDNKGVAPCYKEYSLAIRLKNTNRTQILTTNADIKTWLPGDNLYDDAIFIPWNMPPGIYDLQIGIIDPLTSKPKIKLAIEGETEDGWYDLGKIKIIE
ncbi:MAG: DUF4832 domain-containing protein [Bacteroidetes bacterium]|nr:DUF4832 domain-containing protein [Bacteroidota bacterium]